MKSSNHKIVLYLLYYCIIFTVYYVCQKHLWQRHREHFYPLYQAPNESEHWARSDR